MAGRGRRVEERRVGGAQRGHTRWLTLELGFMLER